jgi:adhesin transport system outer membrane protein
MTIEEAVSAAMQENRQLAIVDQDIEVAEAQIKNVKSRFYPTINLFGEYWRKENDGGQPYVEFEQRLGAEFAYNIYNGGGDVAALKSAEFSHRDAVNTLGDVQRTIEQNVRITWQNLLTAQAKASWFSNQANIEQEFLELARKERKLGNRSLLDVLNAEVNYINAVIGAIGAETDKAVAAYDLMFTMGRLELDLFMQ